jgi:hypothetical protein
MLLTPDCNVPVTASFGLFSLDMLPLDTIDVTGDIQPYLEGRRLSLPKDFHFAYHPSSHQRLFLQINANGRTWYIAQERYHENIVIDLNDTGRRLIIVYFLYINPNANWRSIVSGQLLQLKSYGILPDADLYVHISDGYQLSTAVSAIIKAIAPQAVISLSVTNQFEYPGIKLVHELAIRYPDRNFLYFHSKGMSHGLHTRAPEDVALMTRTFESWRKHLQLLRKNGTEKIGMFPALGDDRYTAKAGTPGGWIWYNFWMATGRYLAGCPEPELSPNRYYYEVWLGLRKGGQKAIIRNDCRSLYRVKQFNKTYFSPAEATYHQNRVMYKMGMNAIVRQHPLLIKSSFTLQVLLKWKLLLKSVFGVAIQ